MEKTFNIHVDLSRTAELVLEKLDYEIIKEERSECGNYIDYTVREKS